MAIYSKSRRRYKVRKYLNFKLELIQNSPICNWMMINLKNMQDIKWSMFGTGKWLLKFWSSGMSFEIIYLKLKFWGRCWALEGPWLLLLLLISAMRGVKYLALAKNVCWSLSLVMLCRTSKCGESQDSRRCWEYCWCWLAVAAEADNHV